MTIMLIQIHLDWNTQYTAAVIYILVRVVRLDCTWIDPNLQVEHLATAGRSEAAGFGRRLLGTQASGGGGRSHAASR